MDQATSSVRDSAAFARRVVLRTLTVLGGAAAGTAIAWCLSTAVASADAADSAASAPTPAVAAVGDLVAPVTTPTSDTIHAVADRLPQPRTDHPLEKLGDRVRAAADRFGERASAGVERLPRCADQMCGLDGLDEVDELGRAATSGDSTGLTGLGRSDTQTGPAATPPAVAGPVAGPGADPDRTAEHTATGRAYSDGMPRRGSPGQAPALPDLPTWPAPFVPAAPSAPAPGHTGSTGNPADSSLYAALPWVVRTSGLVRGLTVPATEVVSTGRPDVQPGVTPD